MKKVAGTLRLDLAAFRELESFAQFGSDLDATTQAKLNRGERTVEVLKQGLHKPLVVEKQVMILYALTHGFLDDIVVDDIVRFEDEFHNWMDSNAKDVLDTIRETGQLAEATDKDNASASFKNIFTNKSRVMIKS